MHRLQATAMSAGIAAAVCCANRCSFAQTAFWNFETPPLNALALTPDGTRLLACNTADARVEVFTLTSGSTPLRIGSIAVGIDPVSVRCRTNSEAWVVNAVSDSVSVIDLATMNVKDTISVGDEPMDVVFAGSPQRAFVSISQRNQIRVFDPATLAEAPGSPIAINGEDPRALATDGTRVYVAIFESGNRSVIIPATAVSNPAGPYGGLNPPPNSGVAFSPPLNAALPVPPPAVSLIVHKEGGHWKDDNGGVWDALVPYSTNDNDAAIINANSLSVSYVTGAVINIGMNLAVNPSNGRVTLMGLYDFNEVRFEPNLKSRFTRIFQGTFDGATGAITGGGDLNPHLASLYSAQTTSQAQRNLSLGDPRGIVWNAAGTMLYIAGMGSNNVIVTDATNARLATINVGQGPCALALDAPRNRVYCMNRFDGTISSIDTTSNVEVLPRISYFDPTPAAIKAGRPHFYNTHNTSGLGQVSCATCHVDGKMDNEAWDLGDPSGTMKTFNQTCNGGLPLGGSCADWHPMKGPMTTQTLVGIIGNGPMHWRADRENLAAFAPAFVSLLGDDAAPNAAEMSQFSAFIASMHFPPQPNRTFTDAVPASVPGFSGNPGNGQNLFQNQLIDGGFLTCQTCHTLPMGGAANFLISANFLQISQSMKVPQLRNMYEKTGFSKTSTSNNRGFGFTHDGSDDSLFEFLKFPGFNFAAGAAGDAQRRDIEAFLMCFPTDTHAAVGVQTTVINGASVPGAQQSLINNMISLANANSVGLIVKGRQSGIDRGYVFSGGSFQSDRASQTLAPAALLASAAPGSELTYTVVAIGTQLRMGVDRDGDGFRDRDELDSCSDPANAAETPLNVCVADTNASHTVDVADLLNVITAWGQTAPPGALPSDIGPNCGDGVVNVTDLLGVITAWGACP